jgi:hypothetical protein
MYGAVLRLPSIECPRCGIIDGMGLRRSVPIVEAARLRLVEEMLGFVLAGVPGLIQIAPQRTALYPGVELERDRSVRVEITDPARIRVQLGILARESFIDRAPRYVRVVGPNTIRM